MTNGLELNAKARVPVVAFGGQKPKPKFCVDCRWCHGTTDQAQCRAPQGVERKLDLVTGQVTETRQWDYCQTLRQNPARGHSTNCGIEGTWFQPKEPGQ